WAERALNKIGPDVMRSIRKTADARLDTISLETAFEDRDGAGIDEVAEARAYLDKLSLETAFADESETELSINGGSATSTYKGNKSEQGTSAPALAAAPAPAPQA